MYIYMFTKYNISILQSFQDESCKQTKKIMQINLFQSVNISYAIPC